MRNLATRLVALCCLVMLAATACSGADADDPPAADAPSDAGGGSAGQEAPTEETVEPTTEPAADFCTSMSDVRGRLEVLDISIETDWPAAIRTIRQGTTELRAIEPPSEVAADLAEVTAFFALITDAFEGVDPDDEAAVGVVLDDVFGPETEAAAATATEAVERIDAYTEENCS